MDDSDIPPPIRALPGQLQATQWPGDQTPSPGALTPLYVTRYAGPRAVSTATAHAFWEITYVLGGEGYVQLEGGDVYLGPEAGLLVPPGCEHREHTADAHWDTLWLGFRGELPAPWTMAKPLLLDAGYALRPWCEQIWLWHQRETGTIGPELAALFEFLLRAFLRLAAQDGNMARKPWLAVVQDYIDHHLARDLPVEELAALAKCSVGHFHRAFRQATGETPVQLITRRRMETALLLLRESGLAIGEIAEAVGFPDPLYFSRVFRRHFGHSPSGVRL